MLKKCIVLESFNPGVFRAEAIQKDIMEAELLQMLKQLLDYTRKRQAGEIEAPSEVLSVGEAKKRKLKREQEKEKKMMKQWKDEVIRMDDEWANWREGQEVAADRWDDEESDPGEECPDKATFGTCSYGRQCGFCHRL